MSKKNLDTTYPKEQQIYSLSFSANSAFNLSWDQTNCEGGMNEMQAYVSKVSNLVLEDTKAFLGSDWQRVWGPVVYADDPTSKSVHADNTMGLYYSKSGKLFVAAIAGTNLNSPFGWFVEDFSVNDTVTWESISGEANSGSIAKGTSIGLNILLNMKDPITGLQMMDALKNFIENNSIAKGTEVAVAGHSLGGALSPVLALYLQNKQSRWDPNGLTIIGAYPTAGPTPGTSKFAKYYEKLIKQKKIIYVSRHNALDIVPHAWQASDISEIPTIYADYIEDPKGANPTKVVNGTLACAAALNALAVKINYKGKEIPFYNPYTQISPSTLLQGTFDSDLDDSINDKLSLIGLVIPKLKTYAPYFRNLVRFAAQAGTQHTTAYNTLLSISEFMEVYDQILKDNKPANNINMSPEELSVMELTRLDLQNIDEKTLEKALKEQG